MSHACVFEGAKAAMPLRRGQFRGGAAVAMARVRTMTPAMHGEFLAVIAKASHAKRRTTALGVETDDTFLAQV